jgi:hypothetical protein
LKEKVTSLQNVVLILVLSVFFLSSTKVQWFNLIIGGSGDGSITLAVSVRWREVKLLLPVAVEQRESECLLLFCPVPCLWRETLGYDG